MFLRYVAFFVIVIAAIVSLWSEYLYSYWYPASNNDEKILVVGVLSAQENFGHRQAARSTWLNKYKFSKNTKSWFIVGNQSCSIPPEYRFDSFSCQKWALNSSRFKENFFTAKEDNIYSCSHSTASTFYQGFSFQVHHPVVVTKLGVLVSLLQPNSILKVAIVDIQSKDVIVKSLIFSNKSDIQEGYIYENVDTILLPKNYEGLVTVEGYFKDTACSKVKWNDGGGFISFKRIYETSEHLESLSFSENHQPVCSVGFYVPDIGKLHKLIKEEEFKTKQWSQHTEQLHKRLRNEVELEKDIVIVDVIDTYRNLPSKLLKFYKWLHQSQDFSFVMKSDDDSLVNVEAVLKQLQSSRFDSSDLWLWSKFRTNWPVNYIGKWADYEYRCSLYPSFPCGSAYVMSHSLIEWLVMNSDVLHTYQGEDVSMGIWLSAVNPMYYNDDGFECSTDCRPESYNRAQLKLEEIEEVWNFYENCGNFCGCIDTKEGNL